MRELAPLPRPIAVCGGGVLSAAGRGWRGFGAALGDGFSALAAADDGSWQAMVAEDLLAGGEGVLPARQRRQMSRSARLLRVALGDALAEAGWASGRNDIGAFLGVGASGGAVSELAAVLAASVEAGELSLRRLGEAGLGAAHPLFSFQLMNNFTLCHGAIAAGLGGPTSALYSRGGGTVRALAEAAWAILDGECRRAVAGGADSALYPVTYAELWRDGLIAAGLHPAEGAAVLALADEAPAPRALLLRCAALPCGDPCQAVDGTLRHALPATTRAAVAALAAGRAASPDTVVLHGFGRAVRAALDAEVAAAWPGARRIDVVAGLGEALAAGPALAWAVGLDLVVAGAAARVLVLSVSTDGDIGVVELQRGAP